MSEEERLPQYSFLCASPDHPQGQARSFVITVHHVPGKPIDRYPCVVCRRSAKRDLASDLASVNMVGATPISNSTTTKGSFAHTTEFAFGRHKKNPDGTVNTAERPFRDSGELSKFMAGQNELGKPELDDKGQPRRRSDGSVIRKGAKLFQYGANATPRNSGMYKREFNVPDSSIDEKTANEASGRSSVFNNAPVHRNYSRRKA